LTAAGWTVTKRGCPDFFLFKGEDFMVIECKKPGVALKTEQSRVMRALLERGIKCCVWRQGAGLEIQTINQTFLKHSHQRGHEEGHHEGE